MRAGDVRAMAAVLLLAPAARAQGESDAVRQLELRLRELDRAWREPAPPEATLAERLLLDYGGSAQFGLWSIDDAASDEHVLRQTDGRAWARAELDGTHRFFGRLKLRYDDWNAGDDFDGQGDDLREPVGERWWYQLSLAGERPEGGGLAPGLEVTLGKQFVEWGEGLAFSDVLIAARAEIGWRGLALDLLAGDTAPNDFIDYDPSRPSFDTNTKRRFLGAQLRGRGAGFVPFVHVLRQIDRNDRDFALFVDPLGFVHPTSFEYDSNYFGAGGRGSLGASVSWRAEFDWELGRALSSPLVAPGQPVPQTREDVRAWAFFGELSWLARDEAGSRVDLALTLASGDDDRLDSAETFGGNLTGTDDRAFNSFGFVNTGLAFAPSPSNLAILRAGGVTSPLFGRGESLDRLRTVVDGFVFLKIDRDAPIHEPTSDDRFVGGEIDVGVDWNVLSDVLVQIRYGLFLPGAALLSGADDPRHLLYGSVSYAF